MRVRTTGEKKQQKKTKGNAHGRFSTVLLVIHQQGVCKFRLPLVIDVCKPQHVFRVGHSKSQKRLVSLSKLIAFSSKQDHAVPGQHKGEDRVRALLLLARTILTGQKPHLLVWGMLLKACLLCDQLSSLPPHLSFLLPALCPKMCPVKAQKLSDCTDAQSFPSSL